MKINGYYYGFISQLTQSGYGISRSRYNRVDAYDQGFASVVVNRLDNRLNCGVTSHQCGNACVPRTKKCRTQLRSPAANLSRLSGVIDTEESKIRNLPYERAVCIDPKTGKVLFHTGDRGDATSVGFTAQEMQLAKGGVLTHNHPDLWTDQPASDPRRRGLSFSLADIEFASVNELQEIRACSRSYSHSLKPPAEGWNKDFYESKLLPTYQKHEDQVYYEYLSKIDSGRMTWEEADASFAHDIITRTSKELKMKYTRSQIKNKP